MVSECFTGVLVDGTITTEDIINEVSKRSSFSSGCVLGVLREVADAIVSQLRHGHNVRLDELGTFSISLASREVTDRRKIRAASVEIEKVNFRPVQDLVKRVCKEMNIVRAEFGFLASIKKYTKEQRWELLNAYLQGHGSITRRVYSEWLGVARTTADNELRQWFKEKRLTREGKHSHVVYLLRERNNMHSKESEAETIESR